MGIFETFSKRKKKQEKLGQVDIYQYDVLSIPFRTQVIYIWRDAIGPFEGSGEFSPMGPPSAKYWKLIHDTLARELGVSRLTDGYSDQLENEHSVSVAFERYHG